MIMIMITTITTIDGVEGLTVAARLSRANGAGQKMRQERLAFLPHLILRLLRN
ncbi:MAG: hypothetical protein ACN4GW_14705 [Desulforhopalus sp.]